MARVGHEAPLACQGLFLACHRLFTASEGRFQAGQKIVDGGGQAAYLVLRISYG